MSLPSEVLARRMRLIAPLTRDVVRERDLRCEMDDGTVLLADRWVARGRAEDPQPTVLVRSPYGRRQFVGLLLGRLLAERGLQVVIQSVRGTFGSEGRFDPFDERPDGLATLRWLRAQPWHAGPVGTIGPSYLGLVQWAIAGPAGEDLAAMAIQVSASQFYDQTYAGGSVSLETIASWMVLVAVQERRLAPLAINRGLRALRAILDDSPVNEIDVRATGAEIVWLREAFEYPGRDSEHWIQRDFSRSVPDVTAPVSFVGGWQDILLPWMLEDFKALQAAGRSPQLLIGPWTHTSPVLMAAGQREGIAWLRAHLLGDDRLVRAAAVRLKVTGDGGGWREYPSWPPPGTGERSVYLGPHGTLAWQPTAADELPGDRYRYDPADPTPSLGGPILLAREPVLDNAPLEQRDDVLTFTTEPLTAAAEAIGEVGAELWVRAQPPYCDLFVRLCEVGADGVSRNVCDGLQSVSPDSHPADGDGSRRVTVALWPTAHRFAAGSRIRVQVSSGAHPRYARNPGTGEDRARADPAAMRPVEVELLRDGGHPSRVIMPTAV